MKVLVAMPAAKSPTISQTLNDKWMAVQILTDHSGWPEILLTLKDMGAQSIFSVSILGLVP